MTKHTATVHKLSHVRRDRGYRFTERDPDMVWLCNIISNSEMSVGDIVDSVSRTTKGIIRVSPNTIYNWLNGKTKKPQNYTLTWVGHALGYERGWKVIK
jgi:IS30 family transposase